MSAAIRPNQEEAFQAGCAHQRAISDLIERLQARCLALAEESHDAPRNWAIVGDLSHIRERLEELLGDRG